jgi:hypothetical protein
MVLVFESRTWARRLTQSPELGFGFCFSSWNGFALYFVFELRSYWNRTSAVVVQGLVHFSAHPEVMQQHC